MKIPFWLHAAAILLGAWLLYGSPVGAQGAAPVTDGSLDTLPSSFSEALAWATGNALFLGGISSLLFGLVERFLKDYWPGSGYFLPERWNRLLSIVMTFLVAFAALLWQNVRGDIASITDDTVWATLTVAIDAIGGKHFLYAVWRMAKPAPEDKEHAVKVAEARVEAEAKAEEPPQ